MLGNQIETRAQAGSEQKFYERWSGLQPTIRIDFLVQYTEYFLRRWTDLTIAIESLSGEDVLNSYTNILCMYRGCRKQFIEKGNCSPEVFFKELEGGIIKVMNEEFRKCFHRCCMKKNWNEEMWKEISEMIQDSKIAYVDIVVKIRECEER